MKKYTCFVISPIGKEGSEMYREYEDLLELVIKPALEIYDVDVMRGDHAITDDKIDTSVIKNIQDADICICDITEPNPNVYYELGRRDETGKPVMLLKRKGSDPSPVDIANRRYFEYNWDGHYSIREAQNSIRDFVGPMIEQGFEERGKSATLGDIAETLSRVERKLDRLSNGDSSKASAGLSAVPDKTEQIETDPQNLFEYALMEHNIPLAEKAMEQLQYRMDKIKFYDYVVEQAAAIGSDIAGKMLMEEAEEFIDSSEVSFRKKTEYLGSLVSYLNRKDKEAEGLNLVNKICRRLESEMYEEDPEDAAQVYNQMNRLYYGLYSNTDDIDWLKKAIEALDKALKLKPKAAFYYNMSTCYYAYANETGDPDDYEKAKEYINACLKYDEDEKEEDADHLKKACQIYAKLNDPRLDDMLARYARVDPYGARVLVSKLK